MTWSVVLEADPDDAMREAILRALVAHNTTAFRDSGFSTLVITVRDDSGTIAGGLWGSIWHDFLFVQFLAMGEAKGGGIGRRVMRLAEEEARRRGCTGIWLDTFSWQAPWFYPRLGFAEFGRIRNYVADQDRIFLVKRLRPADATVGAYVHGYHPRENERLDDQARTLEELLHADTSYPSGSTVLEAGCGVGSQTVSLAQRSPGARFTSVDISAASLVEATRRGAQAGLTNVAFQQSDLLALPFPPAAFDHVFVCFVLEHLPRPAEALARLMTVLKPGGTMTVIEGDHGSTYFHPENAASRQAIGCQVELQRRAGGDAMVGRQLYPLLTEAGLHAVTVSPRMVYADDSKPALVDGFVRRTFTAMIEGVRLPALDAGLIDAATFDEGIAGLHRTAEPGGVFCYTFFKAVGRKAA